MAARGPIAARLVLTLSLGLLAAASTAVEAAVNGPPPGPDSVVMADGARLGLETWAPSGPPRGVIIGVHGMNDYAAAFDLAGPYWASRGYAVLAYDQRGFGRSPDRGRWPGERALVQDLGRVTELARARYPGVPVTVVGESMGAAVAIEALASDRPPAVDRLVLVSPAVWGWSSQPLPNRAVLWIVAHLAGSAVIDPPGFLARRIRPTDNRAELFRMGADSLMLWGARADALEGLVSLMERAARDIGRTRVPTLVLVGDQDQIIPRPAFAAAAARLGPDVRALDYPDGFHLLLVDRQAAAVWRDIAAFIEDPAGPPPSGAQAFDRGRPYRTIASP